MLIVVVGAQGQFQRTSLPIDGVPEAQQHVSGTCRMAIPVALHAGVQEEVLLLIGIAQHALMNQRREVTVARISQVGNR